jgi:Flp pilus assembly protein TadB
MTSNCPMEREKYPCFPEQHERRNTMPLIQLVIVLVIVGVILWVINSYIPMQSTIKKILNVVVIIVVIIWLLSVFGLISNLSTIRIGK